MTTPTAARDFRDAGTERTFKAGEPLTDCDDDTIANYRAAGLVAEPQADAKSSSKAATKDA